MKVIIWIDAAENGAATELDSEPAVSFTRRVCICFIGLLPIESQW